MSGIIPHLNLFQIIFIPLCAGLAIRSLLRMAKGRVPLRIGLLSVLIWSFAAMAIEHPPLTTYFANRLGIHRGTDLVLYFSILAGLGVSFYFYQRSRDLEIMVTEIIRRDALAHGVYGERKQDLGVTISEPGSLLNPKS
jgi:hypothetical protein